MVLVFANDVGNDGLTGEPLEDDARLSVGELPRDLDAFAKAIRSRR